MIRNASYRRALVVILMSLGAVIIFLAPESPTDIWTGVAFVCVGILIELIGITLAHRAESMAENQKKIR